MLPWTHKYAPELKTIVHQKEVEILNDFVIDYRKQKKKAVFLYGPTGIGKTTLVHALADSLNLELLEMNASDYRDKKTLDSVIGLASTQKSLFFKSKLILIDEIDALSGMKDRGCIPELVRIIQKSSFPVILTAIYPWDSKLSASRRISKMVELGEINSLTLALILKNICDAEGIEYDDSALNMLARRSGSDIRSAINDLQAVASSGNISKESIAGLYDRNKLIAMPKALQMVFKSKEYEILDRAFSDVGEDFDEIMLWMEENLPVEYTKAADLYNAFECMSKADLFKGRIRKKQHWRFLVYIRNLLGVGIGLSKQEKYAGFVEYKPTQRILKMWISGRKNAKRNAICEKIAAHSHMSRKEAIQNFKLYKQISNSYDLSQEFELDKEETEYIRRR